MTTNLTPAEIVVFFSALVIAAAAVIPHMPRWFVYMTQATIALYGLWRVLRDGPSIELVGLTVVFSGLAAYIWWHDLRRKPPPRTDI